MSARTGTGGRAPALPSAAWVAVGAAVVAGLAALGTGAAVLAAGSASLALAVAASASRGRMPAWRRAANAVAVGGLLIAIRVLVGPAPPVAPSLPTDARGPWPATVESAGSPRDGDQFARLLLDVNGAVIPVAATLPAWPEIAAGATVEVDGALRSPPDDGFGDYLRRTGAAGTLDGSSLRLLRAPPAVALQSLRDSAGDALERALPEPEAGLAAGILIGLRERVDRDLAAAFTTAGVSHVVAISGWNIAIVAALVGAVMRGRARRAVSLAVAATVVAYVLAAGASPSVVRAAVMAGVVLLARESGRSGRAAAALAWAAVILLVVEPRMIEDAGFRLSVLATAGLVAWATPVGEWIDARTGGRLPGWVVEGLGVSLAAQAATLPDVLATFGRLSLVSPLINLAVVPLVPVAMAAGVLALVGGVLALAGLPDMVAVIAGLPAWLVLHMIVEAVRVAAAVPFASIVIPPEAGLPAGLAAAAAVGGAVGWLRRRGRARGRPSAAGTGPGARRAGRGRGGRGGATTGGAGASPSRRGPRAAIAVPVGIVLALGALVAVDAADRVTRLTVLDVGQGDAILLETAGGARMLIDGGPDPGRLLVELDAQVPAWDRRLDIVLLTHPHEDHVAGLARVLDRYHVGRVLETGMRGPGSGWAAWADRLRDGPPHDTLAAGASLQLDEVRLSVLWPEPGEVPLDPPDTGKGINNVSVVLLGEANGRRFLLTGDTEEDIDPLLLAKGLPRVDVLKVAHHGSATATTAPLLAALRPRLAVVSAGQGNPYGHPAPSTLGRLRDAGARVFRTDRDGTVSLELRPDGVGVRTDGRARAAADARVGAATTTTAGSSSLRASGLLLCAIPLPIPVVGAARARPAPTTPPPYRGVAAGSLGYDRPDVDPHAPAGGDRPGLPPATPTAAAPFVRRGRRGGVARGGHRSQRAAAESRARRDRGVPARHRQGDPRGRPGEATPTRGGLGGLARGPRLAGAGGARDGPPGDSPRRGRRLGSLAGRAAGRARRRVRRQAGRAAPRDHGRSVRLVAPALPRGPRRGRPRRGLGPRDVNAHPCACGRP